MSRTHARRREEKSERESAFWRDLEENLADDEFAERFRQKSFRIAEIDRLMNQLEEARDAAGVSKAELARFLDTNPASLRRLLSAAGANPTASTLVDLAAAFGYRLRLERIPASERAEAPTPIRPRRRGSKKRLEEAV